MTQGEVTVAGQTIEIDFGDMEDRIKSDMNRQFKSNFEKYIKQVNEKREKRPRGRGVVETYMPQDKRKILLEEFKRGAQANLNTISEQWTIAVPKMTQYETAAHIRDFCFVTDAIKGKVGDQVEIPYVKDVDFAHVTTGTGTFSATTGLVSTLTTTLHESGAYYDAYYADIEKINSNLLDELNRVFAHAAVRAEDFDLMNLIEAGTTSDFGEDGYGSEAVIDVGDHGLVGSTFNIAWIADAIGKMIQKGKDVHPGEMILAMNPVPYVKLLTDLSATTNTAVAYARPDIWQKGLVEEYLGVRIVVMGSNMATGQGSGLSGGLASTTYQVSYMLRPKRCLALAPKRDILIETDKIIASRTLRIAATHTYGVAMIDQTEACPLYSGIT